ncbi:MAG: ABC transporter permease subunit [Lentisphaeria bacterium]|nr:ABC transporter permease [Lentisphaeria bacterium]NQZ69565.1 ABC transporter permease subunit [Lentisphaeria bacterium]
MTELLAIAESVWRRILKMKVLYFLVACAIIEISISYSYRYLMANQHQMLMVDVSLLINMIAGVLCVLSLSFDIPKELKEGTVSTLLSKPLGRTQYIIGKYLGIMIVCVVVMSLITIGFGIVHYIAFDSFPLNAIKAHILTILSMFPIAAIGLLFATFLTETVAALLTTAAIFFFHSTHIIGKIPVIYAGIIPDLNLFNLRAEATFRPGISVSIDWSYLMMAGLWGLFYSISIICITGLIFNRKDIK